MSISTDILDYFGEEVTTVRVDKHSDVHGTNAVKVVVGLMDGRTVEGKFTTDARGSFGGVEFKSFKDISGLMIHKINSVLRNTYERKVD